MTQITAWGLISWLVSLGFLHPDASAFELIAIQILDSLISILAAAVVDKGEASRFLRVGILDDFHRVEHTVLPEFLLKVLLLDSGAKIGHVQYVPIGSILVRTRPVFGPVS